MEKQNDQNHKNDPDTLLLEDIHHIASRLKKRNVNEEHHRKVDKFEKFMEDMQEFLNEPISAEEDPVLWESMAIQQKFDEYSKRTAPQDGKKKKKPAAVTLASISEIKSRICEVDAGERESDAQREAAQSSRQFVKNMQDQLWGEEDKKERLPTQKAKASQGSFVEQIEKSLLRKQEEENPDLFRPLGSRVRRKIIHMPETPAPPSQTIEKSTYEWKYKKKSIQELQNFLDANRSMLPENIQSRNKEVQENMEVTYNAEKVNEMEEGKKNEEEVKKGIDDYDEFMNEMEEFLSAPDGSATEVDFKSEIERYIDLIEEPKEARSKQTSSAKPSPKKLNLDWVEELGKQEESKAKPGAPVTTDKKYVGELKNRLFEEVNKSGAKKDEVHVPRVRTFSIKSTYEKLSKE